MERVKIIACVAVLLWSVGCSENESEQVLVWSVISVPEYGKPSLFAIDGRPASHPWAVGEDGTVMEYDGYLWEEYNNVLTEHTIYDLDLSSGPSGWAVGAAGTLLRFTDGDWYVVSRVCTKDLYGVSLSVDGAGWAVGDGGSILKFDGTGWDVYEHNLTTISLRDVVTTNLGTAWAVGDGGTVLYYDGMDWESIPSPTTNTLYGIAATRASELTPTKVFVCGDGGVFFELTSTTWSEIDLGTPATLRSIAIYDEKSGFVVGEGNILFTLMGGIWEKVEADFYPFDEPINLKHVVLISASEGWAVGSNGLILRYGPATDWHGDHMKNKWREDGDKEKERKKKSDEGRGG